MRSIVFNILGLVGLTLVSLYLASETASAGDYCNLFATCPDGYTCSDGFVGECQKDTPADTTLGQLEANEVFSRPMAGDNIATNKYQMYQWRCPLGQAMVSLAVVRSSDYIAGLSIQCMPILEASRWSNKPLFESDFQGAVFATVLEATGNKKLMRCSENRFVAAVQVFGDYDYGFLRSGTKGIKVYCTLQPGENVLNSLEKVTAGEFHVNDEVDKDYEVTACPSDRVATGVAARSNKWPSDKINVSTFQQMLLICQKQSDIIARNQPSYDGLSQRRQKPPPAPPAPSTPAPSICEQYLNGPNTWVNNAVKTYPPNIISQVCSGREGNKEPAECFHGFDSGFVGWDKRGYAQPRPNAYSTWQLGNMLDACKGPGGLQPDGNQMPRCLGDRVAAGRTWQQAVLMCRDGVTPADAQPPAPPQPQQAAQNPPPAQALPPLPDFSRVWSSNYGDINWGGGWYSIENNSISIAVPEWDAAKQKYVTVGRWGRRNDPNTKGELTFTFDGPCAFTGEWWYSGSTQKAAWAGQCK